MTDGRPVDEVDRRLRRGLDGDPEIVRRLAANALRASEPPRAAVMVRRGAWVALLAGTALFGLWLRDRPTDRATATEVDPIRIANFGDLVTVVDPNGGVWLHAPPRAVDDGAARFTLSVGDQE